jgi:hypothetical protein
MNLLIIPWLLGTHLMAVALPPPAASLEKLLTPQEYQEYQSNPKYKKRLEVYRAGILRMEPVLRSYVKTGRLSKARELLGRIRGLVRYALREPSRNKASTKDLHAGQAKKLEICLRRLLKSLKDQRLAVPPEYRREFEAAAGDVRVLRTQLLKGIFK